MQKRYHVSVKLRLAFNIFDSLNISECFWPTERKISTGKTESKSNKLLTMS